MICREIIIQYLKTHGYNALANEDAECGCQIKDIEACEETCLECKPAIWRDCEICDIKEKKGCLLPDAGWTGCAREPEKVPESAIKLMEETEKEWKARKDFRLYAARDVREWYSYCGGEEMGISLEQASMIWEAAGKSWKKYNSK